jgi:hypothetical protein
MGTTQEGSPRSIGPISLTAIHVLLQTCSYTLAMSSASAKRQRRAFLTMRRVPTLSRAMEETLATSVDRIAALNRGSFGFVRQATGSPYLYSAGIRQPRGTFTPPGFEALDALGEAASARPDKDEAKLEYWEAAKRVPFPRGAVQFSNMPPDILAATDLLAELRHDAPRLRAEAIAVLSEISDNLEPLSAFMKRHYYSRPRLCHGPAGSRPPRAGRRSRPPPLAALRSGVSQSPRSPAAHSATHQEVHGPIANLRQLRCYDGRNMPCYKGHRAPQSQSLHSDRNYGCGYRGTANASSPACGLGLPCGEISLGVPPHGCRSRRDSAADQAPV